MSQTIFMSLPDCDENGTPKEKMPNCPNCGEDELGMMNPGEAFCYKCCVTVLDAPDNFPSGDIACGFEDEDGNQFFNRRKGRALPKRT